MLGSPMNSIRPQGEAAWNTHLELFEIHTLELLGMHTLELLETGTSEMNETLERLILT